VTGRAAEEARVKPSRASSRVVRGLLDGRVLTGAAGFTIVVLFGALWMLMRASPPPRPPSVPARPEKLAARIASAQDRLRQNPQDISALTDLGTSLFERGKDGYLDAINALEEARDLGALDPRIFYCLGIMYQEEGLYPYALTEYQRFLRHYPEDKEIRLLAAKLEYRMGRFEDATKEYERLKFQSPDDPVVDENLGLSLWGDKKLERARAVFVDLKARGGDFGRRAEFYLGQLALEAGNTHEAADHFALSGLAESSLPGIEDERAYGAMAQAEQKLGRWVPAADAWKKVLKAAPRDPKARAGLRLCERRAAADAKRAAAEARRAKKKRK
jgi:tetratricopeptide (TPR) repeat protein